MKPARILHLFLALLAAACGRTLELPEAPASVIGLSCADASECATGACVDGVCCERACTSSESCANPGGLGRCRPRQLGAPCDAARTCAEGSCVDGVCCESACEGTCRTCARPDQPGRCVVQADNTDMRRQCGLCGACFSGLCAPATPGTDPSDSCPGELACSPEQTCGQAGGAACDPAHPCAIGDCVAGTCLRATSERIFASGMNETAQYRVPRALTTSPSGEPAVVFAEATTDGSSPVTAENALFVALRSSGGSWSATRLQSDPCGLVLDGELPVAAATFLGPTLLVSGYLAGATLGSGEGCRSRGTPRGAFAQLVFPSGYVGRAETIDADAWRDRRHVLRRAVDGTPWLFRETLDGLVVQRRLSTNATHGWSAPQTVELDRQARGWDAVLQGSDAIIFDVDSDSTAIRTRTLSATAPRRLALPADCTLYDLRAATHGDTIAVTFFCGSSPWLGRYDPGPGAWTLTALPEGWLYVSPLGSSRFPPETMVVAYARGGVTGEAGLAFRPGDGEWSTAPAFAPGYDAFAWLDAEVGADGNPVLLVATGTEGPYGAAPRDLHLVRFHP